MIALTALALLGLGWAYWRGVERLWRRSGRGSAVAGWQVTAFMGGLATVAVAVLPPLDVLAHELLAAHMVQHLLLVLLAPPLLVLGAPLVPLLWAVPARWRRRAHRLRLPPRARRALARPGWVLVAAAVHIAVLWAWHLPAAYEAALRSTLVHVVEHATMLGSALAMWTGVLATFGPRRRPHPVGALAMFATATLTVGLGTLLVFSTQPWYATYEATTRARAVDPLVDQQVAGALMWTFGGIGAMVLGAVLIGVWLTQANRATGEHPAPEPDARADRG